MSIQKIPGTVALRDDAGRAYGLLEIATGRVLTETGAFTGSVLSTHGPRGTDPYPEDGDALLSDYVARYYHAEQARQLGRPSVTMRSAGGKGVQVNMDLGIADVHIPAALPNYAAGYSLAEGVADIVSPVIPVIKQSDKYFTWSSANAFQRVIPNQASPGASVARVNPSISNSTYTAAEYAIEALVPTEIEANADAPLRPYQAAVARVMNALRLEREIRVSTLLATSSNWASANVLALASGAQWNNGTSADPLGNMHSIEEKSYMPITRWIFPEPAWHDFVRSPAVRGYWTYKDDGDLIVPSPEKAAAALKVAPIVVAKMKYTSGGVATYVWPSVAGSLSAVVAVHEPKENPPVSQEDVSSNYTFRWTGAPAPDGTLTAGFMVRSYFVPNAGARGSRVCTVVHNDAEIMTSNIVGGIITGVIQ